MAITKGGHWVWIEEAAPVSEEAVAICEGQFNAASEKDWIYLSNKELKEMQHEKNLMYSRLLNHINTNG